MACFQTMTQNLYAPMAYEMPARGAGHWQYRRSCVSLFHNRIGTAKKIASGYPLAIFKQINGQLSFVDRFCVLHLFIQCVPIGYIAVLVIENIFGLCAHDDMCHLQVWGV
jgi:hypothetical protein